MERQFRLGLQQLRWSRAIRHRGARFFSSRRRHTRYSGDWSSDVCSSDLFHPRNPYAPTTHCNVRFLVARPATGAEVWWFGGGFDLTPYYPYDEDVLHWHRSARDACQPFGTNVYQEYKAWCDRYFFLPHRNETRGVGGLFFDDLNEGGFKRCFALLRSVGDHFLPAYLPILQRRKDLPYGDRERQFQLYRR